MSAQVSLDVGCVDPHNCDPSNVTVWSQVQQATSEEQQEGSARQKTFEPFLATTLPASTGTFLISLKKTGAELMTRL